MLKVLTNRNVQYNGQNQKMVEDLEALLIGKKEPEIVQPERQEFQELSAGQMKQIALPIGKTLEETIDLWRDVRAEAISEPEPTTADYQLAATASAKIMRTEAQIALHNRAQSEIDMAQHVKKSRLQKWHPWNFPPFLIAKYLSCKDGTKRRFQLTLSKSEESRKGSKSIGQAFIKLHE